MNTDKRRKMDQRIEELTERVLGAVFEVANALGSGFLEKVYERALVGSSGLGGCGRRHRCHWR